MKTWEKNIRRVEPYVPGEQPKVKDVVKLNTNENPYPPTPKVLEAAERMNISDLRLYPDPEVTDLVHAIAAYYGMNDKDDFENNSILIQDGNWRNFMLKKVS